WESAGVAAIDDHDVMPSDVAAFITELNHAFPSLDLTLADVTLVHRGVVPAVATNGRVSLEGREQIRDHTVEGLEGLLSVVGAKYTTARKVAEYVTDRVLTTLGRQAVPCQTATTPLPGGSIR